MSVARYSISGWFERSGDVVVLVSTNGRRWPVDRVSFLQRWGGRDEGATKLPRPRERDASGEILVHGDVCLISFPDGNPNNPVIVGTIVDRKAVSLLDRNYDGTNPNRLAVRVAPRDDVGQVAGSVEIEVARQDDGSVELRATDAVQIDVGTDAQTVTITVSKGEVVIRASTKVTVDAPSVELGTNAVEGVLKGKTAQVLFDAHTHGTAFGPTTPPAASLSPAVSQVVTTA